MGRAELELFSSSTWGRADQQTSHDSNRVWGVLFCAHIAALESLPCQPHTHSSTITELMERAIPILPTEDLAVAKTFYVERLGFKVTFEASEDGHCGLLGIARGTIEMTLDSPMSGHGRNACVALHVDDADRYYREWSSKVDVLRAPKDEDWGARTFDLLDPSGNTLFLMGPVQAV